MPSSAADADDDIDSHGVFSVNGELVDIADPEWQRLPVQMLQAMLRQRQGGGDAGGPDRPPCGSGKARGAYNTGLHVFALFLILFLSTAGPSIAASCIARCQLADSSLQHARSRS